jgi:hypothetical protein
VLGKNAKRIGIICGVVLVLLFGYAAYVSAIPMNCPWACWVCANNC